MYDEDEEIEEEIKDITAYYRDKSGGPLKAERRGTQTLILWDLGRPNNAAFAEENRDSPYELVNLWHAYPTSDQTSVLGSNCYYPSEEEIKDWETKSLFDLFQLM